MVLKPEKEAGGRGDLPQMGARLRHRRPHHAEQALHRQARRRRDGRSADQGARRRGAGLRSALHRRRRSSRSIEGVDVTPPMRRADALEKLIGTPDLCSKRWVWEQYDHVILGNTVQRPGGDAAVVRVDDGPKALALTADVTPRYCEADPFEGGKQAVAEAWRNITAVGGTAARDHRQSQFRQSGAAGDHGPVRRLRARHRRGLQGARLPGRVRQRLALQRDQRPRHPADADASAASACSTISPSRRRSPSRPRARRSC